MEKLPSFSRSKVIHDVKMVATHGKECENQSRANLDVHHRQIYTLEYVLKSAAH